MFRPPIKAIFRELFFEGCITQGVNKFTKTKVLKSVLKYTNMKYRQNLSSLLHRAFRRITSIINQQMHYTKFRIKTFKIAPTCFDPKIILRELRCSLLKSF